ncbi:EEF1A lysine methyltransferase 4-like isoform X1 [Zingiber officinale]|uniref:EEF1A lysine methyltransferase 4-like isoform X1 n=1 Tax=Zingiber officinale TaxID=94328 RepID=UPI001C4AA862|nr:EEF1A lysine methyltransferase 4-like isoform X1 [Zingiber officinale]
MSSSSHRSECSYGDALYWDDRYLADGTASFDWYQRYPALRPFIRKYVPVSSRVLMVGCGNALMSEDMVMDGYVSISNIDISSVVIEMMIKKYEHIPQLEYMLMDARDMTFFNDESFDCVMDKGTLDSLMCGVDAPLSASRMLEEINRLLRLGGIYMLITYGDPSVRIPYINQPGCNWEITLYILARPGYKSAGGCSLRKSIMEPVPLTDKGQLPVDFVLEDPDSHYIYVCKKMPGLSESFHTTPE